ncbi:MAG: MBL fold metallo-hydrolase [Gammaproteobacteria bacterium]|nr:MAG: MBL fold metallo-hydrolase [Gammaproteobacteria bacterium]
MIREILSVLFLLLVLSTTIHAGPVCVDNQVQLQVLGSGGPELGDQRASSSYLIWMNGKALVLIDAGAGSSLNFEKSGAKFEDVEAVVFTHLHVDHSADFPAFIKASFFTPRDRDLAVYGPTGNELMPATSEFVENLLGDQGVFRYLNNYVNRSKESEFHLQTVDVPLGQQKAQNYRLSKNLSLNAISVHHGPVSALAWRVNVFDCSITFSGDMSNSYQSLPILAEDTDILVMNNAVPESAGGIATRLHVRPSEIGKIASNAGAKKVVLSHRMIRTLGREQETEHYIKQFYSGPIEFADDLDLFILKPQHH